MMSYRKITGKKSREEKANEASKKMRLILRHDLLDTAFTKPEELPGQKPRIVRALSSYSSANDSLLSTDENELESETHTEDEGNWMENRSEDEDLPESVEVCPEVLQQCGSQVLYEKSSSDDVLDRISDIESRVIDQDVSRTTSASSGHYSTASEMIGCCDSRSDDTTVLDMGNYCISGENTQRSDGYEILEKTTVAHKTFEKSILDVAKIAVNESGFFEESASALPTMKPVSSVASKEVAVPVRESNILNSGFYSKRMKTFSSNIQTDPDIQFSSVIYSEQTEQPKRSKFVNGSVYTAPVVPSFLSGEPTSDKGSLIGSQRSEVLPCLCKLKYCVHYLQDKNQLQVTIIKAINLFSPGRNERSPSTFVKVSLLPQRFCWQKTKVIEETSHPIFNETFVISGFSHERFSNYTLLITVVDACAPFQGFYRDHVIGELHLPLCHVVMYSSSHEKVFSQWAELKPRVTEVGSRLLHLPCVRALLYIYMCVKCVWYVYT